MHLSKVRRISNLKSQNPFSTQPVPGAGISNDIAPFEEALVCDVIVNNDHENYGVDGFPVGAIQFKRLTSDFLRPDENLSWAWPIESNITEYPLKNELVLIFHCLNKFWYFRKFNTSSKVTTHEWTNIKEESKTPDDETAKISKYKSSVSSPIPNTKTDISLGEYFKEKQNVYKLKSLEGDIIYEGRSGQSIRFGASWLNGVVNATADQRKIKPFKSTEEDQAPNILVRIGPDPNAKRTLNTQFGLVYEDINKDKTSLWMVSDQIVPLEFATEDNAIHNVDSVDFPKILSGNQFVVNSDQLVFNAKRNKVLLTSKNGIHAKTIGDITLDTDSNHVTWTSKNRNDRVGGHWRVTINGDYNKTAGRDIIQISNRNQFLHSKNLLSLNSGIILIGSTNDITEPIPLGMTLRNFLEELITILTLEPIVLVTSTPGNPSLQNPARITALKQLQLKYLFGGKLSKILSLDNFVSRSNQQIAGVRSLNI